MNGRRSQSLLLNLGFNLLFWTALFTLILAIRYYDIGNIAFLQMDVHIPAIRIYGNGLVLGILIGIPYSMMELYLKSKGLYRKSLFGIIILRSLVQFGITSFILTVIAYVNFYLDVKSGGINHIEVSAGDYLLSATVIFLFIGAFAGNLILGVFRTLQLKIGEEIFYQLLMGKYSPAKEEERAFMFLDLKSSTTIAEKLGHKQYSFFIQDCFSDLHPAVIETEALVYQYVGDEAVLTWDFESAIKNGNCLKAFYVFERQLISRKEYYAKKYGVVPVFKAGVNIGKVMVAEVGVIKREIAYHSDVLNTAARIQEQCNEKKSPLLAAEDVVEHVRGVRHNFTFREKGGVYLRGKTKKVNMFEVLEKPEYL